MQKLHGTTFDLIRSQMQAASTSNAGYTLSKIPKCAVIAILHVQFLTLHLLFFHAGNMLKPLVSFVINLAVTCASLSHFS